MPAVDFVVSYDHMKKEAQQIDETSLEQGLVGSRCQESRILVGRHVSAKK